MNYTQYDPTVDQIKSQMIKHHNLEAYNLGLSEIIDGVKYYNYILRWDANEFVILNVAEWGITENGIQADFDGAVHLLKEPQNIDIYSRVDEEVLYNNGEIKDCELERKRAMIPLLEHVSKYEPFRKSFQLVTAENCFRTLDDAILAASECCFWIN